MGWVGLKKSFSAKKYGLKMHKSPKYSFKSNLFFHMGGLTLRIFLSSRYWILLSKILFLWKLTHSTEFHFNVGQTPRTTNTPPLRAANSPSPRASYVPPSPTGLWQPPRCCYGALYLTKQWMHSRLRNENLHILVNPMPSTLLSELWINSSINILLHRVFFFIIVID